MTWFASESYRTGSLVLRPSKQSKSVKLPIFLLAARDDELVAPPQLFAVERLVGTPSRDLRKRTAHCRNIGLFMSKKVLREMWPQIIEWLIKPASMPEGEQDSGVACAARA
jgi:hypothetical protein